MEQVDPITARRILRDNCVELFSLDVDDRAPATTA
jgi:hypothetical protein